MTTKNVIITKDIEKNPKTPNKKKGKNKKDKKQETKKETKQTNKKKYGQFYTTNYKYILKNFKIPSNINNIIEPFAGNGDLLNFLNIKENNNVECYDIEPKKDNIIKKDTLLNPPDYNNKFLITNPPYLARNKSKDKTIFDKYEQNDLYKCFIEILITNKCLGGIIIIPLNFWCSIRKQDIKLRERFLNVYKVIHINIFEEQVFDDTKYTTCSFQFDLINSDIAQAINCIIYPIKKSIKIILNKKNNYILGGEIYKLKLNKNIKIERATKKNKENITNILVKCLDDNINNKIKLSMIEDKDRFIDETEKLSARSYATLLIKPHINLEKQKKLVEKFNKYLNNKRDEYHSLFLTNYRESNSIARKRISFKLVFNIVNHLLNSENHS